MNLFSVIQTAKRSILANQVVIQTIQHNISNASTPGYSRQRVDLSASPPYHRPGVQGNANPGQVGTGVEVSGIQRVRDAVLDGHLRVQYSTEGDFAKQYETLSQMEVILGEPSFQHLRHSLDRLWDALQEVSIRPESTASRILAVKEADSLAGMLRSSQQLLSDVAAKINVEIKSAIDKVNSYADRIASLNVQIRDALAIGKTPNDLMDQRDILLDELSRLVNVDISQNQNRFSITIQGRVLVQDDIVTHLETVMTANGYLDVVWADSGAALDPESGELSGFFVGRDILIPSVMDKLNELASSLITELNALHRSGFGLDGSSGLDLFTGTNAFDIQVNLDLVKEPQKLAASTHNGLGGNGENALAMANLFKTPLLENKTWNDFYESVITDLGIVTQKAKEALDNQIVVVRVLEQQREAYSGVSLDEEMSSLIQFHHGYSASAKVITTADEMIRTIINMKA